MKVKHALLIIFIMLYSAMLQSASEKIYLNHSYGFQLRFPASWKSVKVIEKNTNWTPGVKAPTLYFCLPTVVREYPGEAPGYASIFAITVFTHDQLKTINSYTKTHGVMAGEEITILMSGRRFAFSHGGAQDLPHDLHERIKDVASIMKSFQLNE